ncbi:MAG: FAD-dependent oxidoreductase, partial [Tenericutes bacterium]|nr:FAD-dependent oxidoreductase [Mycoplasmatota bacterium]
EDLKGRGISYCAVCDGALFKNKTVAVVGGGDVAVEDAVYLSRIAKKVYLIHRRDELRAVKSNQEKLFKLENVEILWDSILTEFNGKDYLESIDVLNKKTNEKRNISVDGVFVAVGMTPNISFLKDSIKLNETGWIITDEFLETSAKGVFAAGDVRDKLLRQIVTSVSDGAIAVTVAQKYL